MSFGSVWTGFIAVSGGYKLRVDLEDHHQDKTAHAFAEYNSFVLASKGAKYKLSLASYSGKLSSLKTFFAIKSFDTEQDTLKVLTQGCLEIR